MSDQRSQSGNDQWKRSLKRHSHRARSSRIVKQDVSEDERVLSVRSSIKEHTAGIPPPPQGQTGGEIAGTLKGKKSLASASINTFVTAVSTIGDPHPKSRSNGRNLAHHASSSYWQSSPFEGFDDHLSSPVAGNYPAFEFSAVFGDRDTEMSHTHTDSRRRNADTSDDQKKRRHRDRAEKSKHVVSYTQVEFELLKKELENLKKTVHENKKMIKKQSKKIEELQNQVVAETMAKEEAEAQVEIFRSKCTKNEEFVSTVEASIQCQICMDTLYKPFALSPCGHVLCLSCLQEWFRRAPIDDMHLDEEFIRNDPTFILHRPKTCPCCRTTVMHRPIPVFVVKAIANAYSKTRSDSSNPAREPSPPGHEDPWEGLFPLSDDEEDWGGSDDSREYAPRWGLEDILSDDFGFYGSSSDSAEEDDRDEDQSSTNDGDGYEDNDDEEDEEEDEGEEGDGLGPF